MEEMKSRKCLSGGEKVGPLVGHPFATMVGDAKRQCGRNPESLMDARAHAPIRATAYDPASMWGWPVVKFFRIELEI